MLPELLPKTWNMVACAFSQVRPASWRLLRLHPHSHQALPQKPTLCPLPLPVGPSCPLWGLASLISPTPYQIIPESFQCPLLLQAPCAGLPPSRPHCKGGSLISLHPVTEGKARASNQTLPPSSTYSPICLPLPCPFRPLRLLLNSRRICSADFWS